MYVNKLYLQNFRNYKYGEIEFSKGTNVIFGPNATGKTNILEALYFLSYARSHRLNIDSDLIMLGEDSAKIKADAVCGGRQRKFDVQLYKNKKKQISVNNVAINKTSDLLGVLNIVMFCPEDLKIVKGSPKERRRTVDMAMCRFGKAYFKYLSDYSKVLEQRNKLLKDKAADDVLEIWTEKLAMCGAKVYVARKNYIQRLSDVANAINQDICGEKILLQYKCGINIEDDKDENSIYSCFLNELNKNLQKDKQFEVTNFGCHRDDFKIYINDKDSKFYASQGQQRTCAIAIKMAQVKMFEEFYKETPILLLDDVLSELDENRQNYILNNIKNIQTIITCTNKEKFLSDAKLIDVETVRCLSI